jgi:hypothetical protein
MTISPGQDSITLYQSGMSNISLATLLSNDDNDGDLANGVNNSGLKISKVDERSKNGSKLRIVNGNIEYQPPSNSSNSTDQFTYTVTNAQNEVATGTVIINSQLLDSNINDDSAKNLITNAFNNLNPASIKRDNIHSQAQDLAKLVEALKRFKRPQNYKYFYRAAYALHKDGKLNDTDFAFCLRLLNQFSSSKMAATFSSLPFAHHENFSSNRLSSMRISAMLNDSEFYFLDPQLQGGAHFASYAINQGSNLLSFLGPGALGKTLQGAFGLFGAAQTASAMGKASSVASQLPGWLNNLNKTEAVLNSGSNSLKNGISDLADGKGFADYAEMEENLKRPATDQVGRLAMNGLGAGALGGSAALLMAAGGPVGWAAAGVGVLVFGGKMLLDSFTKGDQLPDMNNVHSELNSWLEKFYSQEKPEYRNLMSLLETNSALPSNNYNSTNLQPGAGPQEDPNTNANILR